MDWSVAEEATRNAIAVAVGLPDEVSTLGNPIRHVVWENFKYAEQYDSDGLIVELRLGANVPQGISEEIYYASENADNELVPTYVARRLVNVSVQITSLSQAPGKMAPGTISARLGLLLRRSEAVRAIMTAGNVGFVRSETAFNGDYLDDKGRTISAAIVDLHFNWVYTYTDDDNPSYDIKTIEVGVKGQYLNDDGTVDHELASATQTITVP